MSGQINNWCDKLEPDSKQESSQPASILSGTTQSVPCSTTSKLSCTTAATTFSSATEPPPTPTKTSGSADYANASDNDQSNSDSEERAAAIASKGKGKAGMKTFVEIESGSDSEERAAAITGQENQKVAMQEPQASNDDSNMPLAGTPFADLPYSKQLEIVSYALKQATPHTIGKRKIEEVMATQHLSVNENNDNDELADDNSIDVDTDLDAQEKTMVHTSINYNVLYRAVQHASYTAWSLVKVVLKGEVTQRASASARALRPLPEYMPLISEGRGEVR
ncbi:uncharacterized protein EDB91DRAFT_1256197 [Suillus paluster]|uniref:uncharacterized protein n=1 Tax=Suillus paluster TaxID=48578 RepID=UPI001B8617B2|nr:uncharacterized protein EDB91DRAFT_1256197 [Suillus paluster]KAG1722134.1 hypothetical protein EDB91DRAFT_1256197 [Suillus paluster]